MILTDATEQSCISGVTRSERDRTGAETTTKHATVLVSGSGLNMIVHAGASHAST